VSSVRYVCSVNVSYCDTAVTSAHSMYLLYYVKAIGLSVRAATHGPAAMTNNRRQQKVNN